MLHADSSARAAAAATAGGSHLEPLPAVTQVVVHSSDAAGCAESGGAPGAPDAVQLRDPRQAVAAAAASSGRDAAGLSLCAPVLAGLGHVAAAACLALLAGKPLPPSTGLVSRNARDDLYGALQRRERDVFGCSSPVGLWPEDLEFLMTDVWGRSCALTGAPVGGEKPLVLTRWDRSSAAAVDNLVLLTKAAAEEHDRASAPCEQLYGAAMATAIERALRDARHVSQRWRAGAA